MKIVDSFLFFQELDLLEIRLEYLNDHVDIFLIVEASQTFSGLSKDFIFEKNISRFEKYLNKIVYFKIDENHSSYDDLIQHLKNHVDSRYGKIGLMMENMTHFPKNEIRWVLDTYHRELISIKLCELIGDEDLVILSDLDEIPSHRALNFVKERNDDHIYACRQREYRYSLNNFKDDKWIGSIFGRKRVIKNYSLNLIRLDSKFERKIVFHETIDCGGYHFTSCGNLEMIKSKIKSWAHQEFNNAYVMKNLDKNIKSGKDIFMRERGVTLTPVNIFDELYFDEIISKILAKYDNLISIDNSFGDHKRQSIFDHLWIRFVQIIFKFYSIRFKFRR